MLLPDYMLPCTAVPGNMMLTRKRKNIELAAPVSHIWYFKGIPSRMGLILDLSPRVLEKVLYSGLVTSPRDHSLIFSGDANPILIASNVIG